MLELNLWDCISIEIRRRSVFSLARKVGPSQYKSGNLSCSLLSVSLDFVCLTFFSSVEGGVIRDVLK